MLFIAICVIIFCLAMWGIVSAHDKWWAESSWDEWDLGAVFWAGCVGAIFAVVAPLAGWISLPRSPHSWGAKIVSVQDGQQTQGEFVLGSGYIGTEAYYTCYYSLGGTSYAQGKVPVEGTTIIEDAETADDAHVDAQYTSTVDWSIWVVPSRSGVWYHTAQIHVPAGTIIRNFNLNGN